MVFDALDPKYPVTMSRDALDGILRDRFKFDGVVFSDDMEMKAITAHFGLEEAMVRGAGAGIDVFPISHTLELQNQALELLIKAAEKGKISPGRIEQSKRRVDTMIALYYQPPTHEALAPIIGCKEHHVVVQQLRKLCDESALAEGRDPTEFV